MAIWSRIVQNDLAVLPGGVSFNCLFDKSKARVLPEVFVHFGMKVLGSFSVQGHQLGVLVLEPELVDCLELLVVEAGVVAVLEASLLLNVITKSYICFITTRPRLTFSTSNHIRL